MAKVQFKRSSVAAKVPLITDLDYGELAVNYQDGILYYKTAGNTIGTIGSAPTSIAASIITGTLGVAHGGSGLASITQNAVVLGNGTSALQAVAPGASGNVLTSDGTTWVSTAATGGTGGFTGSNALIVNQQTQTTSQTIAAGTSAVTVGPYSLAPGAVLTVAAGGRHIII